MSIFSSSIGKKLIMSISGIFLVLFLTLHMVLNFTSVFSAEAFQKVCDFMGSPVISIMVPVLAFGFVIHIIYAFILTASNLKSRGGLKRYEVATKTQADSWASKNMIYLGAIVLLGLAIHLTHFWSKMQLAEFTGGEAADPNMLLSNTFDSIGITILYLVWFVAIWLHLSHGFWSALQTIGWNNDKWLKRLKVIGIVYVTILMAGFAITAIVACCKANGLL